MRTRPSGDRGASAVEYALIVTAIAGLITLVVFALGNTVKKVFSDTCSGIKSGASVSATGTC
jgi:pilus assembly protein Flp/PilA